MSNLNKQVHDIRKPLNAISMQAELIKMLIEMQTPDSSNKVTAAATTIIEQAKLCSTQLQTLFEYLEKNTEFEKR
ncbi:histidine kinase [Pseudoalteromonas sp. MMG010]|uniref:histidine kinase dimerization/phospho-acceptor domain-containing protein n=1 Tax=Pseudoalteromonas sp. MMG010 TaxID=2822685 RepID=UPI001B3A366D|nr:histidine kinase dimerization/phospho-acceptor domain-containing protein [Pseudoalteromonas sp. MMG010]MBQ4833973.1 histidine kinase [Pseudoalteromonas sp. MMG010]